jgi:hypothetical protein
LQVRIFPIAEILAIEDNELHGTFLHVAFESQSPLRTTSDLTISDSNWRTEGGDRSGGDGEQELNQILLQELDYVPSSNPKAKTLQKGDEHTNQQRRNDPLNVKKSAQKEWDQLDTQLAKYCQNREQTSG